MSAIDVHFSSFSDRSAAERHFLRRIDEKAEAARESIITAAPGQSMTYEAKHQEAERFVEEEGQGEYPWLSGEAEALDVSVENVADSVIAARQAWQQAGIQIEQVRLSAKKKVRSSDSEDEMRRAVNEMVFE